MARRPMLPALTKALAPDDPEEREIVRLSTRERAGAELRAAEAVILAALRLLPQTKVPSRLIAWTFAEKDVHALDRALARLTGKRARR